MNQTEEMLRLAKKYFLAALAAVSAIAFTACDPHLFDGEGDCDVLHIIRFRYERNLKWADAFPSEVNSVNLYVYDADGLFVKSYLGRGEALSDRDYFIELDLPAGDYKFVAWCGLENDGVEMESFTVPQPVAGVSHIGELTCALNTKRASRAGEGNAAYEYSDERLKFLYYGRLDVNIEDNHDGRTYEHIMYLTKDTNHIRIILQETQAPGLETDDYDFTIEDANSIMEHDNSLRETDPVIYRPWRQDSDELGIGKPEAGGLQYVRGIYADLSAGRMMASHKDDFMLTIRNRRTQETIVSVPVLHYALLSRKYYEEAYGHTMADDQEFLDREDEYVLTFFLVNGKWTEDMGIMIHSWRVVRHDYDLGL